MQSIPRQPSLKERQRQEREALILQTAEEAFLVQGYHETSIDEIAARVGVSKGTVYQHFPSKEDLLMALLTTSMERFLTTIEEAIASASTVPDKLEALISCLYAGWSNLKTKMLVTFFQDGELRRFFSANNEPLLALRGRLVNIVIVLLEEGKATGDLNAAIPTQVMVMALFALFSTHMSHHFIEQRNYSEEELFHGFRQVLFQGIMANPPTSDNTNEKTKG